MRGCSKYFPLPGHSARADRRGLRRVCPQEGQVLGDERADLRAPDELGDARAQVVRHEAGLDGDAMLQRCTPRDSTRSSRGRRRKGWPQGCARRRPCSSTGGSIRCRSSWSSSSSPPGRGASGRRTRAAGRRAEPLGGALQQRPIRCSPADLPGHLEGVVRVCEEDFLVEELPLYEPSGTGEHFISQWRSAAGLRRRSRANRAGVGGARARGGDGRAEGQARGHRPADSVATRSIPAEDACRSQGVGCVVSAARHGEQLRPGHLRGNRFRILVRGVFRMRSRRAEAICTRLRVRGGEPVRAAAIREAGGQRGARPRHPASRGAGPGPVPAAHRALRAAVRALQPLPLGAAHRRPVRDGDRGGHAEEARHRPASRLSDVTRMRLASPPSRWIRRGRCRGIRSSPRGARRCAGRSRCSRTRAWTRRGFVAGREEMEGARRPYRIAPEEVRVEAVGADALSLSVRPAQGQLRARGPARRSPNRRSPTRTSRCEGPGAEVCTEWGRTRKV